MFKSTLFRGLRLTSFILIIFFLIAPISTIQGQATTKEFQIEIKSYSKPSSNKQMQLTNYWSSYFIDSSSMLDSSVISSEFDPYSTIMNLEYIYKSNLSVSYPIQLQSTVRNGIDQLLNLISYSYKNSFFFANITDNQASSIKLPLSDLLYVFNESINFLNQTYYTVIINKAISGFINSTFVNIVNNSLTYGFYAYYNQSIILSDYEIFKVMDWIPNTNYSSYLIDVLNKKLETIRTSPNPSSWLNIAYDSLLFFKTGSRYNNKTLISYAGQQLTTIMTNQSYKYDNDSNGYKAGVINDFVPYNITIANNYANFIISMFFNYTWGLEPLVSSVNQYNYILGGENTFLFRFDVWTLLLKSLINYSDSIKYTQVLKENAKFLLSTLYYDQHASGYLSFIQIGSSFDNGTVSGSKNFSVIYPHFNLILSSMFSLLNSTDILSDYNPPNLNVSYFNSNPYNYTLLSPTTKLQVNNSNSIIFDNKTRTILLKIFTFDNESGLKNFSVEENNNTIASYPETFTKNISFYDFHQIPLHILKVPNYRVILVPITKSSPDNTNYIFHFYDKLGNEQVLTITYHIINITTLTTNPAVRFPFNAYIIGLIVIILLLLVFFAYIIFYTSINHSKQSKRSNFLRTKNRKNSNTKITDVDDILIKIETIQKDLRDL